MTRGNAPFNFRSEMLDETLNWPSGRITKSADRMSLNLARNLLQRVNFVRLSLTANKSFHHPPHPPCALTARRALATGLMLVEIRQTGDCLDDVGVAIHDDNACRAKTRSGRAECAASFGSHASLAMVRAELASSSDYRVHQLCAELKALKKLALPPRQLFDSAKLKLLASLLPQLRVLRVEDECDLLLEGRGVVLACSQLEV